LSACGDIKRWDDSVNISLHIQEGLQNLFTSKLRSMLALLGILVGTASVVAMVLGGQLATNEALKQFKTLGTDLLAISLTDNQEDNHASVQDQLSLDQARSVMRADKVILDVAPYTQLYQAMQYEGHELNGGVLGVTESFSRIVHVDIVQGRFISTLDKYAMYAVVGDGINKKIMQYSHRSALGQQVQVGNAIFTVVGIAKPWPENSFVYANIDNSIMVPLLTTMALSKYASISNMILRLSPDAHIEQVQHQITKFLMQYVPHKRLFFRSAQELIDRMAKQSQIFTVFLGLIGSISLLVGGIGVMNIMLVSVVERRREIGIRLAVGAKRSDIRTLFLVEAVMLALLGGTLGVVIGIMIAYVMAIFWHWEFIFFFLPPVIGFAVSVATGVFFGFYPAYKAAKLDPILALRAE